VIAEAFLGRRPITAATRFIDGARWAGPWTAQGRGAIEEAAPSGPTGLALGIGLSQFVDGLPADPQQVSATICDVGSPSAIQSSAWARPIAPWAKGVMGDELFQFAAPCRSVSEKHGPSVQPPKEPWWIDSHSIRLVKGLLSGRGIVFLRQ